MATMFPCPNCGGQLKFDAESQKLLCGSCGSFTDIETYKPNDNIGFDSVNTNIYSCPNCGGEIQLIDNDGMEFCPFCGSQATMHEKFSTEGAPKYILPFQLNKKAARDKYKELTKKMHFIPGGLEKEENIEKLVGLYVPYYLYEYNAYDRVQFTGVSVYTSGEYTVTDRANIDVRLDVDNLKVPFDASQALDDSIATKLEPFAMNKVRDFHPAYLAGFFVENSTVDQDLYTEDSKDKAADYLVEQVLGQTGDYTPECISRHDIRRQVQEAATYEATSGTYMPLYFMTTKYDDRVAYSIINGSTGKAYMDMPIDKRKMLFSAIRDSAIIFLIIILASFMFNFSFKVKSLCAFSAFTSSLIGLVGAILANKTYRSDNHLDDKGYFQSGENKDSKLPATSFAQPKKKNTSAIVATVIVAFIAVGVFIFASGAPSYMIDLMLSIIPLIFYPASAIMVILSFFMVKKGKKKVMLLGLTGWGLSIAIRFLNLPNDIYYYFALLAAFTVIFISINSIVDEYNMYATHPLPQFSKKGGRLENARN